ncbi:MAG: hypothetical protein LBD41_03105 [Clostridiales Family XIII bacterium]|jgi:endogenous inhibitor of DNA gyrase (YacG/DUF329 family)|nr:hypothetical protein [Clostridiales Family XIII bacterium]
MRLIELIDQCYDKKGRLVSGYSQKKIISSCEDYYTLPGNTFQEKIFLVKNNLTESKKCPVCGKELVFYKSGEYRKYCSNHCKANSLEWKSNRIGKGFQSAEVQKKSKEVLFERYGVSGAAQIQEVKEKIRNTLKRKVKNGETLKKL